MPPGPATRAMNCCPGVTSPGATVSSPGNPTRKHGGTSTAGKRRGRSRRFKYKAVSASAGGAGSAGSGGKAGAVLGTGKRSTGTAK
ncbi:MAG: hypothetical protein Q6370_010820 [Candidatus Sigynarchaeota archaeon]